MIGEGIPRASGPRISLRDLTKTFRISDRDVVALQGVDLDIAEAEFVCLLGPSGCGKSTILRILAGLERETSGTAVISVPDVASKRPLTSMVFQEASIFPWMNVLDNIGFGLKARGVQRPERVRIAKHYSGLVGLAEFSDALPRQLSGGMKQRVAIARAFANDPEVLLMDEPFAALDEQTKLVLQTELLSLWESARKTILYVTHSIDEAILMADRIVVMSSHPGRILERIQVPFERPRTPEQVRGDPAYGRMFSKIWELLGHGTKRQRTTADLTPR